MTQRFIVKELFTTTEITDLVQNFGLLRMPEIEIQRALQNAFSTYILSALEEQGDRPENNRKLYIEAAFHLGRAQALLEGLPHPAGKMAYRLSNMQDTLNKLIEGRDNFAADRANRFMEKNLVRRIRDIWITNTATPFHTGGDGSGKNPRDFILACFGAASSKYPEILWFQQVDHLIADMLIKGIKR